MRNYYSIIDFRKTGTYLHDKITKQEKVGDLRTHAILTSIATNKFVYLEKDVTLLLDKPETCIDHSSIPCFGQIDGIYDMWLRDCKNVTHISIELEGINEPVYTKTFDTYPDAIQIPLAFQPMGEHVKHMFYEEKLMRRYTSFFPVNGLIHNKMIVKLNEGAEATLELSTVYMPTIQRREMAIAEIHFFVDGKEYIYYRPKFFSEIKSKPLTICEYLFGRNTLKTK